MPEMDKLRRRRRILIPPASPFHSILTTIHSTTSHSKKETERTNQSGVEMTLGCHISSTLVYNVDSECLSRSPPDLKKSR